MITISIATDFSRTPGPRYENEGKFSGQQLRKKLVPLLRDAVDRGERVQINLDGTAGYGTSFLEEAFGGLVRHDKFSAGFLTELVEFISEEEDYLIDDIHGYWADAESAEQHGDRRHER